MKKKKSSNFRLMYPCCSCYIITLRRGRNVTFSMAEEESLAGTFVRLGVWKLKLAALSDVDLEQSETSVRVCISLWVSVSERGPVLGVDMDAFMDVYIHRFDCFLNQSFVSLGLLEAYWTEIPSSTATVSWQLFVRAACGKAFSRGSKQTETDTESCLT